MKTVICCSIKKVFTGVDHRRLKKDDETEPFWGSGPAEMIFPITNVCQRKRYRHEEICGIIKEGVMV